MHKRLPKIRLMPASEIRVPEGLETDPQFQSKLIKVMKGEAPVALTRLPVSHIVEGFYRKTSGQPEHVVNRELVEGAGRLIQAIRGGHRPSIEVYWSALNPRPHKYVCPDAEAAVVAYRELGISQIPVRVMNAKKSRLTESAICIYEAGEREGYSHSIVVPRTRYRSFWGASPPKPEDAIARLAQLCAPLEAEIARFHKPFLEIHYHHVIREQVIRHRELLESMGLLLSIGRVSHCFALLRLMYEGFLNHYLDWLSPEIFGPRLHALSAFRRHQARERREDRVCKDDEIRDALGGLLPLLESVEQKAQLSPLGGSFYRSVYPTLSFVVHQDYGEKSAPLDWGEADSARDAEILVIWADAITATLLWTISSDLGNGALEAGPLPLPRAGARAPAR